MQEKFGLPALGGPNSLTKQAIFGLNSARIYGLGMTNVDNTPLNFGEDKLAEMARSFRERGEGPSHERYGYVRTA